jgi:hypothetical protein
MNHEAIGREKAQKTQKWGESLSRNYLVAYQRSPSSLPSPHGEGEDFPARGEDHGSVIPTTAVALFLLPGGEGQDEGEPSSPTEYFRLRACLKTDPQRRVRARGLQERDGIPIFCRPGPLTGQVFKQALSNAKETTMKVSRLSFTSVVAILFLSLLRFFAANQIRALFHWQSSVFSAKVQDALETRLEAMKCA